MMIITVNYRISTVTISSSSSIVAVVVVMRRRS